MSLKVGIIGAGRKGMTIDDETRWLLNYDELPCSHASAFAAVPDTEVVAVANVGEDALQDYSRRYGEVRTYNDASAMLESEELDIVSVATHAHLHAEYTIA